MAADGPSAAKTLRYLACSLAALNPAPWEKVGSETMQRSLVYLRNGSEQFFVNLGGHVFDFLSYIVIIYNENCGLSCR